MTYNIAIELGSLVKTCMFNVADCSKLLTNQVRKVLKEQHDGEIRIWKQIKLDLGGGTGSHFIRAFHDFDASGKFFDWVQVKAGSDIRSYLPAKVLLLYQTEDQRDFALVWPAKTPTDAERKLETNLSARWKMDLLASGLPRTVSVPTDTIERCILVQEHWKCSDGSHLPSAVLRTLGSDTSMFAIEEAYDRYSWLLNFLDDRRWRPMEIAS